MRLWNRQNYFTTYRFPPVPLSVLVHHRFECCCQIHLVKKVVDNWCIVIVFVCVQTGKKERHEQIERQIDDRLTSLMKDQYYCNCVSQDQLEIIVIYLLSLIEMRPVGWWSSGPWGDWGFLQGVVTETGAGCCIYLLFSKWLCPLHCGPQGFLKGPRRGCFTHPCPESYTHLWT